MIQYQTNSRKSPRQIASALYLGILSRHPAREELERLQSGGAPDKGSRRQDAVDLAWALINSAEFLYRH